MAEWLIRTDWFSLDKNSLYDRIINVCLFVGTKTDRKNDSGEDIYEEKYRVMIRSDYMPYYDSDGNYEIRKVLYKPNMLFKATTFNTDNSIIAIDASLDIKNFFFIGKEGRLMQNLGKLEDGEEIYQIKVQLGYWGNFQNIMGYARTVEFLQRTFNDGYEEELWKYGITCMKSKQAYYIKTVSIPPDAELQLKFYIGEISPIDAPHSFNISFKSSAAAKNGSNGFAIDEKAASQWNSIVFSEKTMFNFERMLETKESEADYEKRIRQEDNATTESIFDEYRRLMGASKAKLLSLDGGLVMVMPSEEYEGNKELWELIEKYQVGTKAIKAYDHTLPAYYNIAYTEFCTIECPFFFWVHSMDYIRVRQKYATTSQITYYMESDMKDAVMTTFKVQLEFGTTDKSNKMTIVCFKQEEKNSVV